MYLGMFCGPIAGVLSGISSILDPPKEPLLPIITIGMSFISGVIVTIIKLNKFDNSSLTNKLASARYSSLENNVRRQLSLYTQDRISPLEYLEWLSESYNELLTTSPLLPTKQEIFTDKIIIARKNLSVKKESLSNSPKSDKENKLSFIKIDTIVDLERYSDGMMNYELSRMNNK